MSNVFGENFDYGNSPLYMDDGEVTPITTTTLEAQEFEGDIKLFLDKGVAATADIQMGDREVVRDPGLETAVMISLLTDRRAGVDDEIPDSTDDRRGWWGDALAEAGDADGSLLWLDTRLKLLPTTLATLEDHAKKALQWMLDDGVAKEIRVKVALISAVEAALALELVRPDGSVDKFRYQYNWNKQVFGRDG